MKKRIYFVIPFIIGVIFVVGLNKYLDYSIEKMLKTKDLTMLKDSYGDKSKDLGIDINNYFLKEGNIMMIGASDLKKVTEQRPGYFFNTNRTKNGMFTIGQSHVQELQDAIQLGSVDTNIENQEVVLLTAFSWFVWENGIGNNQFQLRFSPQQFYAFLENDKISSENKDKVLKRCEKLLKGSEEYKTELLYIELYKPEGFLEQAQKIILTPYFKFRREFIDLKEKGILYISLCKMKDKDYQKDSKKDEIDWDKEFEKANKDGEKRVNGNDYGLDDKYYNKTLKKELGSMKNKFKDIDLLKCKELEDYELFLDICLDLGIKPTVVIVPGFPKYYEHTGITVKKQKELYTRIEEIAKDRGFNVINPGDKAGNDYYLRDVMHFGTVGWTDVAHELYKIYENKEE